MQVNICFGDRCSLITSAESNWSWAKTASYVQEHLIDDGTIIPGSDGAPATYVLVRPGRLNQKWTHDMGMDLDQASTVAQDEQSFEWSGPRSGPFTLHIMPTNAAIVNVEDKSQHTIEILNFDAPSLAATTEAGFLTQIKETIDKRRESLIALTQTQRGLCGKITALARKLQYTLYEMDPINSSLYRTWRAGDYRDPQYMPIIEVKSRCATPVYETIVNPKNRRRFLALGLVFGSLYVVNMFAPESFDGLKDKMEEYRVSLTEISEDLSNSATEMWETMTVQS